MKKLLVPVAALGAIATIGVADVASAAGSTQAAPAGAAARPHSGRLHLTKECSAYTGGADQHCTITSSNVKALKPGSRIVYLEAARGGSLDSDIVVVVGRGNYALGHVTVDLTTGNGRVTLSGGAGQFASFHVWAAVSPQGGANFAWDGKYNFR